MEKRNDMKPNTLLKKKKTFRANQADPGRKLLVIDYSNWILGGFMVMANRQRLCEKTEDTINIM